VAGAFSRNCRRGSSATKPITRTLSTRSRFEPNRRCRSKTADLRKLRRDMNASPSKKSRQRVKQKVRDLLILGNEGCWEEVRDRVNQVLGDG
jgi:hypothetical protein